MNAWKEEKRKYLPRKNTRCDSRNHGADNIQFSIFPKEFFSFSYLFIYITYSFISFFFFHALARMISAISNVTIVQRSLIFSIRLSLRLNVTSNKRDTQQRIHLRIKGEKHGCIERGMLMMDWRDITYRRAGNSSFLSRFFFLFFFFLKFHILVLYYVDTYLFTNN